MVKWVQNPLNGVKHNDPQELDVMSLCKQGLNTGFNYKVSLLLFIYFMDSLPHIT